MNFLKKYRHTWVIPAYGILYLLAFQYVEQRSVRPHIIHMKVDDYIIIYGLFLSQLPFFTLHFSTKTKKNTGSLSAPWA